MLTQFDIIVCFITLIFMTLGLFKGAIRSILGLGKWYGAGVLTLLFYPQARDMVAQFIQPGMVVNGIAVILTYIVALIGLSILIGIFVKALGGTVGGPGDRLLGAIVGLTIGAIISSTGHYFIRGLSGGTDPSWIQSGATYELTSKGADKLQVYFKDVVNKMGTDMGLATSVDTSGILDKINQFKAQTGSDVDFEKLKEAIRMMKAEGLNPDQIKDMINIQDYMVTPGSNGSSTDSGNAASGIAEALKGNNGNGSDIINKLGLGKSGSGTGMVDDDMYKGLRTYKGPGNSTNADGN